MKVRILLEVELEDKNVPVSDLAKRIKDVYENENTKLISIVKHTGEK